MTKGATILGLEELKKSLDGLPMIVSRNLRYSVMTQAAQAMKSEAVNLAPRRSGGKGGTLRNSITIERRLSSETKEPTILLGPVKGKQAEYDAWYAHFQEFGTKGFGKRRKFETWDSGLARTAAFNSQMSVYQRKVGRGTGRYIIVTGYRNRSVTNTGLPAVRFMERAFDRNVENYKNKVHRLLSTVVTRHLETTVPKYAH